MDRLCKQELQKLGDAIRAAQAAFQGVLDKAALGSNMEEVGEAFVIRQRLATMASTLEGTTPAPVAKAALDAPSSPAVPVKKPTGPRPEGSLQDAVLAVLVSKGHVHPEEPRLIDYDTLEVDAPFAARGELQSAVKGLVSADKLKQADRPADAKGRGKAYLLVVAGGASPAAPAEAAEPALPPALNANAQAATVAEPVTATPVATESEPTGPLRLDF